MNPRYTKLKAEFDALKAEEPQMRNRDYARKLGISEAELLCLNLGNGSSILEGRVEEGGQGWKDLLIGIKEMGHVMALTRNENCVHERKGIYDNIEFYGGPHNMGVAANPDIDLRFFMNEWRYGLAVAMPGRNNKTLYSFQFFNKRGEAVHKVYSTEKSNIEAYHRLVDAYKSPNQSPFMDVDSSPERLKAELPDAEIDIEGFREDWKGLKDTHQFFGMLRKYKASRTQGFRLAPEGFTQKIDNRAVVRALEAAARTSTPIMCFLHSRGCVQIHTGEVKNLKFFGEWYNVLDPQFNLHLRLDQVAETWIVKKPTEDGIVTSLELFDKEGELIVYFFGKRKPGIPELEAWRAVLEEVRLSVIPFLNNETS